MAEKLYLEDGLREDDEEEEGEQEESAEEHEEGRDLRCWPRGVSVRFRYDLHWAAVVT